MTWEEGEGCELCPALVYTSPPTHTHTYIRIGSMEVMTCRSSDCILPVNKVEYLRLEKECPIRTKLLNAGQYTYLTPQGGRSEYMELKKLVMELQQAAIQVLFLCQHLYIV